MWRHDAQLDPDRDIRVFEDALPAPLFARIVRAVRDIGDERIEDGYDTTFWFPRDREPANLAEHVVTALTDLADPPGACVGTEWWLGRLPHGKKLPMHFDRDLTRSRKRGEHEYPILGSILYLNSFPSSPTVIVGQVPGASPRVRVPKKPAYRESVAAVPNRYAVFRGNLRHGVVPAKDAVAEERSGGTRVSLLVNYWHLRPMPPICLDYDGTVYGRLREG